MASLTPIYLYRYGGGYGLRYCLFIVENATSADTVTVNEVGTVEDTMAFQMDTGAAVACTEATNVVTVGGAITSLDLIILVSGH